MNYTLANEQSYAEIPQTSSTKFAFVHKKEDGSYEEQFYPVKCRDFLGDAVYTTHSGKPSSIYRFSFNGKVDTDKTRLAIHFGNPKEYQNFLKKYELLHKIEETNGFEQTTVQVVTENVILLIEGDKAWIESVWAISLYTFLLRCASYSGDSLFTVPEGSNEAMYKTRVEKLDLLLDNVRNILDATKTPLGWTEDSIGAVHNSSGFTSLFSAKKDNVVSQYFFEKVAA